MSNMSYCRWENTRHDLIDCLDALNENDYPESDTEKFACRRLFEMFLGWCVDMSIIEEWDQEELLASIGEYVE